MSASRSAQVKFVNEPVKASSTTTTSNAPRTTGSGTATTTTTTTTGTAKDYPDHAMVNMTKDQLKALPAFKYASDTSATADHHDGSCAGEPGSGQSASEPGPDRSDGALIATFD